MMLAEAVPLSPYLAELAAQRKILLVAVLVLLCAFLGIQLDRSLIAKGPEAFVARVEPQALETALPAAFYAATTPRRATRARSAPRGQVPSIPEIFAAAGSPAPDTTTPDALAATGLGPAGAPTATQTTLADGGQFIGLPGGGGGGSPGTPGPTLIPEPGPPAVPEPETWAMIVLGVGLSGWVLRKRRRAEQGDGIRAV